MRCGPGVKHTDRPVQGSHQYFWPSRGKKKTLTKSIKVGNITSVGPKPQLSELLPSLQALSLTSATDKSKTATFTGYGVDTSEGYAVYPFTVAERKVNGTVLTWNLPESYTYTEIDADFFESAQSIPMYAKVSNGNASFKHLGAIVAFKFNDWTLTGEHVFTLTSSKKITGEFTTDLAGTMVVLLDL